MEVQCLVKRANVPQYTLGLLQGRKVNRISKVQLDLRYNANNSDGIDAVVILSDSNDHVKFREKLNGDISSKVLAEIITTKSELEVLSICGANLTWLSLEYLRTILRSGNVTQFLPLTSCHGDGALFNMKNYERLRASNKYDIRIGWFYYIGDLDLDRIYLNSLQVTTIYPPNLYNYALYCYPVLNWVATQNFNTGVSDPPPSCATRSTISDFSTASLRTDMMSPTQSVFSDEAGSSGNAPSEELQSISGSWATDQFSVNAWSGRDSFAPSSNISKGDSGHNSGDEIS
uniref:uncharacterized protein LOC120340403 n=1 Tax=Styela clava TaxID=7725 RepID=UPI001939F172|nr:uncharacterized protein LOC120340403 [Styela clava]